MARARRSIDMLPLLDIFMVVLFVFATIQEGKLDATTQESVELSQELESAQASVAQLEDKIEEAEIEENQEKMKKTEKALEAERERTMEMTSTLEEQKQNIDELEKQTQDAEAKLKEIKELAEELQKQTFQSDDQYRQQNILDKLLDQHSVFEVEIRGEVTDAGIKNMCCVRDNPLEDNWQSCGEVPAQTASRDEWWRGGGTGLLKVLRATKGGNAMTVIRQDANATFQIGAKLEELVRESVSEQKVYNEGIALIEVQCQ